jgi:hypothetical protein
MLTKVDTLKVMTVMKDEKRMSQKMGRKPLAPLRATMEMKKTEWIPAHILVTKSLELRMK